MSRRDSPSMPNSKPEQGMRAYRACMNCRNRKTRCDLNGTGGHPPCKRCLREQRECVLCPPGRVSQRAGRSGVVRNAFPNPALSNVADTNTATEGDTQLPNPDFEDQQELVPFASSWYPSANEPRSLATLKAVVPLQRNSTVAAPDLPRPSHHLALNSSIASADLQNPSDAFGILAQVANSAEDFDPSESEAGDGPEIGPSNNNTMHAHPPRSPRNSDVMGALLDYKPVTDGLLSHETVYELFARFEQNYHPFFPIAPRDAFEQKKIPQLSLNEPHLFSTILTIASKDSLSSPDLHEICYSHTRQLVSSLLTGADAGVEAVEALLLLAEWVSHWPPPQTDIGRGEEDKVAWMYVGTALRLGYFLDLDRTAFDRENGEEEIPSLARRRLAWAACYMCDRNVSVRLGKGFWSRGPGPMVWLRSQDFPSLQPISRNDDDYATILQANLELTQIFSNAHDILYSRKGRGWKLMLEGDYVKYIDDFRSSIRIWQKSWGTLTCSPRLKASLLLTYEYLRLYVNAFAYQATVSRAMMSDARNPHEIYHQLPDISAATPDARFIYEALDAAKSLLTTVNNFVDPEQCLRYMPSKFYLFIIYSAVFLYKAWSTTRMTPNEKVGVRRMISETIDRLQRASVNRNDMGSRYSRLLHLLWRKSPMRNNKSSNTQPKADASLMKTVEDHQAPQAYLVTNLETNRSINHSAFSWLDLDAVGNFATQNNSASASIAGDVDHSIDGREDFTDLTLFTDCRWLNDENSNMIF